MFIINYIYCSCELCISLPCWRTLSFIICYIANVLAGVGEETMRPAPFLSKHPLVLEVSFHMVVWVAEKSSRNAVVKWKQLNSYIDSLNTQMCSHHRNWRTYFNSSSQLFILKAWRHWCTGCSSVCIIFHLTIELSEVLEHGNWRQKTFM